MVPGTSECLSSQIPTPTHRIIPPLLSEIGKQNKTKHNVNSIPVNKRMSSLCLPITTLWNVNASGGIARVSLGEDPPQRTSPCTWLDSSRNERLRFSHSLHGFLYFFTRGIWFQAGRDKTSSDMIQPKMKPTYFRTELQIYVLSVILWGHMG